MFPNLKKWAFFYISPDFSPQTHTTRQTNADESCTFITVGFDPSAKHDGSILEVATTLYHEGVQTIEICGGFGPEWVVRISDALEHKIPVGLKNIFKKKELASKNLLHQ